MLVIISSQDLSIGLCKTNTVLSNHAALVVEHDQEETYSDFLVQAKLKIKHVGA